MDEILKRISQKKARLDKYLPIPSALVKNLEQWFRVELTYTSNAIEGNTLSRQETAQVIEKGITVEGKTLNEHLEAINHVKAIEFIKTLLNKKRQAITQRDILDIHRIILSRIDDSQAGRYRNVPVRIAGALVILPNPLKIPTLMNGYEKWFQTDNPDHPVKIAADAHYRLVTIHPFSDGNGRTARLVMNLLLIQDGYPPAIIRKEDRKEYINSLESAQLGGSIDDYYKIIYTAVERSLNIYLEALENKEIKKSIYSEKLLKIGELAKETDTSVHTIRYWTKEGLLTVSDYSKGGYQLYKLSMLEKVRKIRKLQNEKRLTIKEIRNYFVFNQS